MNGLGCEDWRFWVMKRKKFMLALASFLLAYVAIVNSNTSFWWVGEPELPRS